MLTMSESEFRDKFPGVKVYDIGTYNGAHWARAVVHGTIIQASARSHREALALLAGRVLPILEARKNERRAKIAAEFFKGFAAHESQA